MTDERYSPENAVTRCGKLDIRWGSRTYVMGIINLSPDSFSGDGLDRIDAALEMAKTFVAAGVDILDVGGMSTRPGLAPISTREELRRVIPAIEKMSGELPVPVSVDTIDYEVATRAVAAGAAVLNDQWGLKKEPRLATLAAAKKIPIVLMSNQRDIGGFDAGIGRDTSGYEDVMAVVASSLKKSIETARRSGVPAGNIIIDPGLGFGKTWRQDLEIVRRLRDLRDLSQPVLVGPSRKSFIKMVLDLPPQERVEGTAAAVAISICNGADIVRVHDVKQIVRVCRMADAIVRTAP